MRASLAVLPEKYSERNIVTSVMGVLNDYIPLSQGRAGFCDEQVFWVKFEDYDCCGLPGEFSFTLILSIGTCKNFYLWGLSLNGRALLLFSERNLCTIDAKLLPTPHPDSDKFGEKRPIFALCDVRSRTCCFWQVRFMSLADGSSVRTHSFESKALSVEANLKYVLVARLDCITVLDARTLEECFTIARVRPTIWSTSVPRNVPYSLSTRWLAFSDSKPVLQNLSRCGDGSTEEPLTSAVMNVNKKIWSSLSAIANTMVSNTSGAGSGSFRHDTAHPVYRPSDQPTMTPIGPLDPTWTVVGDMPNLDSSTNSPGYVTVVDLEFLHTNFLIKNRVEGAKSTVLVSTGDSDPVDANSNNTTSAIPKPDSSNASISGTMYLDVHENCGNGSVVAHFMAHRWANVALIKFDSTGTLLFTACTRGHAFNVFRISNHPCDQRQTAVHHLYILERGNIPCEVMDATFSRDSRWLAVSTNHGTTHVFPITPYGGPVTVRTHTRPYVVNRTSRYHRSSGLEEHHLTRPQPERGAPETLPGSSLAKPSTPASSEHTRVSRLSSPPVPGSTLPSHGAPVPILTHQPPGTAAHLDGNSDDPNQCEFQSPTLGSIPATYDRSGVSEATLTCSCNALYNITNPRLPPYPEPCPIKPEARLRPHNPANSTSGAAAAALGAATGALEVVTTGYAPAAPMSRASHHVSMYRSPQHYGPCAHYPASAYSAQFPQQRDFSRCQPLPIVDQDSGMFSGFMSTVTMAARFALPICFLPNHPRSSGLFSDGVRDPYGSRARAVNSLFILTPDLYLVEYDLSVGPAETTNFGEKLYQDGSIRLDCSAVGQWNLHTDLVYPPPFPQNHPFAMNLRKIQPVREASEISAKLGESPKNESECVASGKEEGPPKEPTEVHSHRSDETTVHSVIRDSRDSAFEDNASYWYSQVEITTHLGPLRRVWMGPQFTFRTYSKQDDSFESSPSNADSQNSLTLTTHSTLSDVLTSLKTTKQLLPPIIESSVLSAVYGSSKRSEVGLARAADLSFGTEDMGSSSETSHACGTNLIIPESKAAGSSSPLRGQSKPSGGSRSQPGRLLEGLGGSGSPAVRWRNRSGDLTRPMSITGPLGDVIENSIVIEGGSYQDSSLGGSLSSLAGRNAEDVVSCIAEAIQDEDVYWPNEKSTAESDHPSSLLRQSTPQASVLQFNVRPPVFQPTTIAVQSALSEADFPSHESSPLVHEEPAQFTVGSFPESTVIGGLEVPDESTPFAGGQDVDQTSKESSEPLPTSSELTTRNVKKGKRLKKSRNKFRKSGSACTISQMQGDNDSGKNIRSSMTSPCPSGPDSLSTSPDVSNPPVAVTNRNLLNLSPLVAEGTKNEDSSHMDDASIISNPNLTICSSGETQGELTQVDSSASEPKAGKPTSSGQPDSNDTSTLVSAENVSPATTNILEGNENAEATPPENQNQPPTEEAKQASSENPQ